MTLEINPLCSAPPPPCSIMPYTSGGCHCETRIDGDARKHTNQAEEIVILLEGQGLLKNF